MSDLCFTGAGGVALAGEGHGEGPAVLLMHGLTATRRYVVMGSTALERAGFRVVAYDARGHGRSAPAPSAHAYTYDDLAGDALAVLNRLGLERATLAGASMGAHTAVRLALTHPERVAGLALITPAYDPGAPMDAAAHARWDARARGLRDGGVEGFLAASDLAAVPAAWRTTVERVIRQRLAAHEHPGAVADALEAVPRSRPFEGFAELRALAVPVLIVGSRDEADPEHPLALAERYAAAIPHARLAAEPPPPPLRSPIAWQGGRLSELIAGLARGAA